MSDGMRGGKNRKGGSRMDSGYVWIRVRALSKPRRYTVVVTNPNVDPFEIEEIAVSVMGEEFWIPLKMVVFERTKRVK